MTDFDLAAEWERLTHLGYAPQLIYDDNGNFAVGDEGFGPVRTEDDESFSFNLFGEPDWFKPTPKEAWDNYIERIRELGCDV
jgi:hypothetical protein